MATPFEWTLPVPESLRQLEDFKIGGNGPQFVSAGQDEQRILARYFVGEDDGTIRGHVRFGDLAQGPPGFAHGGALASVLDELMGIAAWQQNLNVVAAELLTKYRRPTPLWAELHLRAWIVNIDGRRAEIASEVTLPDGTVCCRGEGTFVNIGKDKYKEFIKEAAERKAQSE